jgi:DNA polymerase-1
MILGVDGTNWVHVIWHARGGKGVVRAVCDRLQALVDEMHPAAVVCCFDRRSFRHALIQNYKAGRKEKDASLVADLSACEKAVAKMPDVTVAAEDGFEADDCLATLARWGRLANERTVIASPDKDLRQCLGGPVILLRSFGTEAGRPIKPDWYSHSRLFDETGLHANQWTDYQALVGDRGDSIDGCKGWGDVTTRAALIKCKTLAEMFANPWSVPCNDKQRGALIEFRKRAELVLDLVTLRTEVSAVWDALR